MRQKIIYIITIVVTFFFGAIGTIILTNYIPIKTEIVEKTVSEVTITEADSISKAVEKIYDAVVLIESYQNGSLIGTGTGFVYKKDDDFGYIMTNNHVIEDATSVKVITNDGRTLEAEILGGDGYSDIAVLSIDKDEVTVVAEIGSTEDAEIGDTLFTVGSPLGSEYMGTVTKGILSGKDRTVTVTVNNSEFMMEVLQTDAAINPGNSGGPLVNINGEVIGVNSMKLVQDEVEGMGFAIPIELAMASASHLEKGEDIKHPIIGVEIVDATETYLLYRNNILLDKDFDNGVVVVSVSDNYPAVTAGIEKGDVILEIDGVEITSLAHFRYLLYKHNIGDTITVKYYRDGEEHETQMTLDKSIEDDG
ncbi:MAG: trypsin-like peptidase domain-containing protein [Bacilli bacterium]|nr:trypsin-like peptidase domain-containing protein [Bacilli bacterium]